MQNNNSYRVEAFMGQINGPLPPNFSNFHTTMGDSQGNAVHSPTGSGQMMSDKYVSSVWDLQNKQPDLYKNFVRSLASEINNQSRNSSERIRKNIKESSR